MKIEINIGPKTRSTILNEQLSIANRIEGLLAGKSLPVYNRTSGRAPLRDEYQVIPWDPKMREQNSDIVVQIPNSVTNNIPYLERITYFLNSQQDLCAKLVR